MIELIQGDCLREMQNIPDNSIDCIITDPPYGTTACKWDSVIDFELMWEQLNRIIKPNGAIVLFGTEPFSSALRLSNIKNFRYDIVWEKPNNTNFMRLKREIGKRHEMISVFYKKQPTYNPQMKEGKPYKDKRTNRKSWEGVNNQSTKIPIDNSGTRYPSSVQKFCNVNKNTLHPTQKPVELLEYLIKTYTNENETVLDFTMGSGSTMVACVNTKRKGIGIELDETYYKLAKKRVEEKIKEKDNEAPTLFGEQN